ncbi:hypothetical protein BH11MYX1_BH11MYX1_43680 [soil metagenome]
MEVGLNSLCDDPHELLTFFLHCDEVAVEVKWSAVRNVGFGSGSR